MLLIGYLAPHLYEKGFGPQPDNKGNKVSVIRTRNKVTFRDVTKLLAPSASLRSFGKLFNLEQCKAHFPFGILDSVRVLELPELPGDLKVWQSDLAGPPFTESDLREARELFDKAGCRNLGDYLKAYLSLDVEILLEATQRWRRHLKEVIGLDFLEHRKFTISSLSYTAGLKKAEANLRIGTFFPNNSQIYRLLRRGMRG